MDMANSSLVDFDASTVPLASSNLIEASAGTGKTYSIAILVLRLLLEKQIGIKEILMVTFTKAAVAELEERIRLFVRRAYQVVEGADIDDETVRQLVNESIEKLGTGKVRELLNDAMIFLDETSVMTIHSFCQQTLTEFAFETNQLFGVEIINDISLILEDEVNQFWRKNITLIPTELLKSLLAIGLSRNSLKEVIKNHLEGRKYLSYQEAHHYSFTEAVQTEALGRLLQFIQREKEYLEDLYRKVAENAQELKNYSESHGNARRYVLPLIDRPEAFLEYIQVKKDSAYIRQLYSDWIDACELLQTYITEREQFLQSVLDRLYSFAIQVIQNSITSYKHRNNILTFSDLILNMHKALTALNNEKLIAVLQKKYKAVFVDEFQDSDRLQYEIFQTAFGENTILFYIGDPKQSIYAWRQADINTYFKAYNDVSTRYGMNVNYRSSAPFIQALNLFFKPHENFDALNFKDKKDTIGYINVDSPQPNKKGVLYNDNLAEVPITIYENANKPEIIQALSTQLSNLLKGGSYHIEKDGRKSSLKPSDIGILVKTNAEAKEVKDALTRYGVLAITIDDNKVLQSEEARNIQYLLTAFLKNKLSHIHKALLSPITGYSRKDILSLCKEAELERFKGYGMLWRKEGIYVALRQFIADFSVKSVVLKSDNGERSLTNIFQLIEVLHNIQSRKKLSDIDLIHWLQRGIEGVPMEGDEYEQRIESDDEAVKIVTIHKSKGLEYPIVFAPFLDLCINTRKDRFYNFREENGNYLFAAYYQLTDEHLQLWKEQEEQEYRRLIYVSVTRAIYKCYIYRNQARRDSSLLPFVNGLKALPGTSNLIKIENAVSIMPIVSDVRDEKWNSIIVRKAPHFELSEKYWRRLSYTFLASKNSLIRRGNSQRDLKEYDLFIFKQLSKGSLTGNLLHDVLERVDFSQVQYWEKVIISALKKFMPHQLELYTPLLMTLMKHTSNAFIQVGDRRFKLHEIPQNRRLTEFEFDFNVQPFNTSKLNNLLETNGIVHTNYHEEIEGIMNGKIDLFFEYQGQYFILDWKSNFLGDALSYYHKENLKAAMDDHNYHLQYLIYTLAVKKYLQHRISDFDYEKHFGGVIYVFLRGVREGTENGIFTYKPTIRQILSLEAILSG